MQINFINTGTCSKWKWLGALWVLMFTRMQVWFMMKQKRLGWPYRLNNNFFFDAEGYMLQSFKIIRTGSETFSTGIIAGAGIGFVATELADGTIAFGVEADFLRARMSLADINQLLPGANGIGGFTFANPVVQIKSVADSGGNKKLTLETAE